MLAGDFSDFYHGKHPSIRVSTLCNLCKKQENPKSHGHSGWEFRDGIPVPVIAQWDPAPTQLTDVIRCQCKALGKSAALTPACDCYKQHMSCTSYCKCSGKDGWCNQYTDTEDAQTGDESAETGGCWWWKSWRWEGGECRLTWRSWWGWNWRWWRLCGQRLGVDII